MHGADTPNLTRVAERLNRPERPEIDAPGSRTTRIRKTGRPAPFPTGM